MTSLVRPQWLARPGRVDGRFGYSPHGLNVGGEPCVWCGGGSGDAAVEAGVVVGWESQPTRIRLGP